MPLFWCKAATKWTYVAISPKLECNKCAQVSTMLLPIKAPTPKVWVLFESLAEIRPMQENGHFLESEGLNLFGGSLRMTL
jgi:hypothetical protein